MLCNPVCCRAVLVRLILLLLRFRQLVCLFVTTNQSMQRIYIGTIRLLTAFNLVIRIGTGLYLSLFFPP